MMRLFREHILRHVECLDGLWKLTVGGKHANGRVSYANGSITVSPLGTRIILR